MPLVVGYASRNYKPEFNGAAYFGWVLGPKARFDPGKKELVLEQGLANYDVQADLYMQATCDMTLGAFYRRLNPAQQRAVTALCGGEGIPTLNSETGLLE